MQGYICPKLLDKIAVFGRLHIFVFPDRTRKLATKSYPRKARDKLASSEKSREYFIGHCIVGLEHEINKYGFSDDVNLILSLTSVHLKLDGVNLFGLGFVKIKFYFMHIFGAVDI